MYNVFDKNNYKYAWRDKNVFGVTRQFIKDIKCCYQRITLGYCDRDLWNIDDWFLSLIPEMLIKFNKTRHSFPVLGTEDDDKRWSLILRKIAHLLRESNEDTCSLKNPYEKEYDKALEEFSKTYGVLGRKLLTKEEREKEKKEHVKISHTLNDVPKYREIVENYFEYEKKIAKYRSDCKTKAIKLFNKYFWDLWD